MAVAFGRQEIHKIGPWAVGEAVCREIRIVGARPGSPGSRLFARGLLVSKNLLVTNNIKRLFCVI